MHAFKCVYVFVFLCLCPCLRLYACPCEGREQNGKRRGERQETRDERREVSSKIQKTRKRRKSKDEVRKIGEAKSIRKRGKLCCIKTQILDTWSRKLWLI